MAKIVIGTVTFHFKEIERGTKVELTVTGALGQSVTTTMTKEQCSAFGDVWRVFGDRGRKAAAPDVTLRP